MPKADVTGQAPYLRPFADLAQVSPFWGLRMARASQANRSASKKPRVECDRCLWPYRDSRGVWVVWIYHNVSVAARSDD